MKIIIITLSLLLLGSCTQRTVIPTKERTGRVVTVDVTDKNLSDEEKKLLYGQDFVFKKRWYKMTNDKLKYNKYKSKNVQDLGVIIKKSDPNEITKIIEALGQMDSTAVEVLVGILQDKRPAVFSHVTPLYWYAEKNKPAEELELRIYAALNLERLTSTSPYGISFDFHTLQTKDKGSVQVLYAVKGQNAVSKDDVCKKWLQWWETYKSDYTNVSSQ